MGRNGGERIQGGRCGKGLDGMGQDGTGVEWVETWWGRMGCDGDEVEW